MKMEIYSIRSSQSFNFRNNNKSNAKPDDSAQPAKNAKAPAGFSELAANGPDFSSISMSEVRALARQSFDQGKIDHDTFSTLYEGLPMQAIDTNGSIIDLSEVTDTTPFNFRDFYQSQLNIASTIGDPRAAQVLQSVLRFMNAG